MYQWDRNTTGRLERISAPQKQSCEVSLNCEQMEPPLEEQHSQQGVQRNPNAYKSMRDHIHPSRVSALMYCTPIRGHDCQALHSASTSHLPWYGE